MKLLGGLIWRSRTVGNGSRRVNYYLKHMLLDVNNNFQESTKWLVNFGNPTTVCHPVIVLLTDMVWARVASFTFLYGKAWFLFSIVLFLTSQSILEHIGSDLLGDEKSSEGKRSTIFACRVVIYVGSMTTLIYTHACKILKAYLGKDTGWFLCLRVIRYLEDWQNSGNLIMAFALILMFVLEPILWCWNESQDSGHPLQDNCAQIKQSKFWYCLAAGIAMILYFALLIDLAVFSNRVFAFVLVWRFSRSWASSSSPSWSSS